MRVRPPDDLGWPGEDPPSLFHTVSIRIEGGSFDPAEMTAVLGVAPTEAAAAFKTRQGTVFGSSWALDVGGPSIDAGALLAQACALLEPHTSELGGLLQTAGASLRVCVRQNQAISLGDHGAGHPEVAAYGAAFVAVPPEILSRVADVGASLWMLASPWIDEVLDD